MAEEDMVVSCFRTTASSSVVWRWLAWTAWTNWRSCRLSACRLLTIPTSWFIVAMTAPSPGRTDRRRGVFWWSGVRVGVATAAAWVLASLASSAGGMVVAASMSGCIGGGWEGTWIAPPAGSSTNLSRTLAAGLPLLVWNIHTHTIIENTMPN